jgi:Flp pilus assembly protein TadD
MSSASWAFSTGRLAFGKALFDAGKYSDAIAAYLQILATRPADAEALEHLARAYLRVGNVPLAREALDRLRSVDPGRAEHLVGRSR